MEDWQLETLVAALLAGPRSPDIVDKFQLVLAQIRKRGGLRAIYEKTGLSEDGERNSLDPGKGQAS
jgi:hypothetical protein